MTTLREAAQQALEALLDDPNKLVQISEHHWESKRDLAVIALRAALAEPVKEMEREPANAHDKVYSEVELADAYQKGWNDAMFRRSLGPHIIKEGT